MQYHSYPHSSISHSSFSNSQWCNIHTLLLVVTNNFFRFFTGAKTSKYSSLSLFPSKNLQGRKCYITLMVKGNCNDKRRLRNKAFSTSVRLMNKVKSTCKYYAEEEVSNLHRKRCIPCYYLQHTQQSCVYEHKCTSSMVNSGHRKQEYDILLALTDTEVSSAQQMQQFVSSQLHCQTSSWKIRKTPKNTTLVDKSFVNLHNSQFGYVTQL